MTVSSRLSVSAASSAGLPPRAIYKAASFPQQKEEGQKPAGSGQRAAAAGELLPHRAVSAPQLLAPLGPQEGRTGTARAPQGAPKPPE